MSYNSFAANGKHFPTHVTWCHMERERVKWYYEASVRLQAFQSLGA